MIKIHHQIILPLLNLQNLIHLRLLNQHLLHQNLLIHNHLLNFNHPSRYLLTLIKVHLHHKNQYQVNLLQVNLQMHPFLLPHLLNHLQSLSFLIFFHQDPLSSFTFARRILRRISLLLEFFFDPFSLPRKKL